MERARLLRLTLLGLLAILAAALFAPASAALLEPAFAPVAAAADDDPEDWAFDGGDVPLPEAPAVAATRASPGPLRAPSVARAEPPLRGAFRARGPPGS
jgi:hypothetical protein